MKKAVEVIKLLEIMYPNAHCELDYTTPFELLIATILSAQCTDKRVNQVTKVLFENYNTPEAIISMGEEKLQEAIKSCGFYNNKSKNILGACQKILYEFEGEVPNTIEDLMKLPGVGKKTANVVGSNAYGIPAIAVDTHVFRVSKRIGIAQGENPDQVEESLMKNLPKKYWILGHHLLIFHGRYQCTARSPKCESCGISKYCTYYKNLGGK